MIARACAGIGFARVLIVASLVIALQVGLLSAARALPEVKLGTGVAVTPAQADTYYASQGLTSPAWSEDPDLRKLAAALGNDPDRIYAYVRNEIDVIPLFGIHAGARGCYIDKACTPFDQAEFMVELLRSAGVAGTYQMGTITLTGAQFNSWFGITNAVAARKLLADGGFPSTVSGTTTVTSVTMSHLWVRATIGGVTYSFDPAFKAHATKAGINVATAMGHSAAGFLSTAIAGAVASTSNGTAQVSGLNRAGIRSSLSNQAQTLLTHLKTNLASAAIEDVIGGRSIIAVNGAPLRQAGLPYQAGLSASFSGDVPLALRTRVSLAFSANGAAQTLTWNLNEIYGNQIAFEQNYNRLPPPAPEQFRILVGERDATGWLNGGAMGGTLTVNQPYAAGTVAGSVNGTYMDRVVPVGGHAIGAHQIVIASGRPSSELAGWQERQHTARQAHVKFHNWSGDGDPLVQPQQIATRRRMATAWLIQFQQMAALVGRLANTEVVLHDVVGVSSAVGSFDAQASNAAPAATSYMLSMEPALSVVPRGGDMTQVPRVMRTIGMMSSALEGSVGQQIGDATYAVSTVAQLDWAHAGPGANSWYYAASSANWAWVKSQILADYQSLSPMREQAELYVQAGYTVYIPRSSSLGPAPVVRTHVCQAQGPPDETTSGGTMKVTFFDPNAPDPTRWPPEPPGPSDNSCRFADPCGPFTPGKFRTATRVILGNLVRFNQSGQTCKTIHDPDRAGAFIAIHPVTGSVAHISSRLGAMGKGGGGSNDVETNPSRIYSIPDDFLDQQFSSRAASQDVDLKNGTLAYTPPPDLTVGNGGYPYALSFQRTYRSGIEDADVYVDESDPLPITSARDPIFGYGGWSSNLQHYASVSSDGSQIFGQDDPRAAAQTIVTAQALLSLVGEGSSALNNLQRQIAGTHIAAWWAETIQLNTLTIRQGHDSRSFTRLADGTFALRGSAEVAELLGVRELVAPFQRQHKWRYKTCVRVTGAQRDVTYYGVWNAGYSSCLGGPDNGPLAQEGIMGFVRQTFPFGVTVTWDGTTLANSLGRSLRVTTGGGFSFGATISDPVSGRAIAIARSDGLLSVTDAMGRTWRYLETVGGFEIRPPSTPNTAFMRAVFSGGALGIVSTLTDALGNVTTYNIGGGRVSSVVSPLGHATRTRHDRHGNVVSVEDPLGRTTRTEYDNLRRRVKEIAPEGNAVSYAYDDRSNVRSTTRTAKTGSTLAATTTTATWDTLCNIKLSETNALLQTTHWSINQTTCLVTEMRQPTIGGQVPTTRFVYNGIGKMVQTMDPTGLMTQINYDNAGNPTAVIVNPGAAPNLAITTLFGYDSTGNVTSVTDPRGKIHTGSYDAARRLTQYNAPAGTGVSTIWTYDSDGLITQISRANGATPSVTAYSYWPTGRVRTMTDPDGQVTRYDYDAASRLTFTTDPALRRTLKVYNAASEVVEERRAVGTPVEQAYARFTYTLNGKQASVRDARGNQTAYTHDGFDRPLRTTFPNATFEELAYDTLDRLVSKRTRGNQTITNSYDVLDRLVTHSVPQPGTTPAIVTTTTYDLAGRVLTVSDTTGQGLSYGHDRAKRIISVGQTAPNITGTRTVSYGLDAAGNKTRLTWPDGYSVSYDYDALNRMTVVRENGTFVLATYLHDPLSRRASLVYGNGTTQAYAWSQAGDLTAHTHTLSGTANIWTLGYSKAHQLVSEAASNAAWGHVAGVGETTGYGAANSLNQYVTVTQGTSPAVTLMHDANGNMTGEGTWAFAYDAVNRLRTATRAGTAATYLYDPAGRRQAKVVNSVVTSFLSDGAEEIAEYTGAGGLLRRYVPGPGTDQPIAMVTPVGAGQTRSYFHVNRQGSTVAMSNDAGTVSEGPYTYDAYGQGASSAGVPFKYTGRRLDPETGLYYYRARYYSAALGRFLQTDPIGYGDDMNMYAYVGGDPVNRVDPTGQYDVSSSIAMMNECGSSDACQREWVERQPGEILGGVVAGAAAGSAIHSAMTMLIAYSPQLTTATAVVVETAAPGAGVSGLGLSVSNGSTGFIGIGKYADESIAARSNSRKFSTAERVEINRIGASTGCHTCGTKIPGTKSGNFVPDHQPSSALLPNGGAQRLYPQCINCSREQGLAIAREMSKGVQ